MDLSRIARPAVADTPKAWSGDRLSARAVELGYGERRIVADLSLSVPDRKITVVIGPNACGKSTLLRALGRLLKPSTGSVLLDGHEIARLPTREVAKRLGLLPQTPIAPEGILVADLVARGRTPHQSAFQQWSAQDERAVLDALEATEILDLADRRIDELSGGQRQRVWIAMALAQETSLLLLDEPTTFLDLKHQIEILSLVRRLNRNESRTFVMVLHDLNLACRYADHIVAMRDGRIVAEGAPADVVTAATMQAVFGLDCQVIPDPVSGTPLLLPALEQ
ncbi:MAG: ABC transporter ATP-binding protein [Devosia nanyangense]|uniref:ABC transporter ATP-binding protein n=1 Tax=Devosia nanyangense TaxID=1228055 RepID=A0A933P0Q6_9HYPH|nr:ABC transporter ATP-binding protein [Devosia nanyangense]